MGFRDGLKEIFLIDGYVVMEILRGWKKQRVPSSRLTLTTNLREVMQDISRKMVIIGALYIWNNIYIMETTLLPSQNEKRDKWEIIRLFNLTEKIYIISLPYK